MNDTIYVVCGVDYFGFDDYTNKTIRLTDRYFTNEEQAEMYMEYLELKNSHEDYNMAELKCGDDDDYAELIKEEKERIRIKQEKEKTKKQRDEIRNYALSKSRIEGGNLVDIYNELLGKYGLE